MANRKMESAEKLTIEEWRIAIRYLWQSIMDCVPARVGSGGKWSWKQSIAQAMEDFMEGGKQDVKGC